MKDNRIEVKIEDDDNYDAMQTIKKATETIDNAFPNGLKNPERFNPSEGIKEMVNRVNEQIDLSDVAPNIMSIGTQFNGDVTIGRDLNSGNNIQTTNNINDSSSKKKWYEHTVINRIVELLGTLLVAFIIYKLGWN